MKALVLTLVLVSPSAFAFKIPEAQNLLETLVNKFPVMAQNYDKCHSVFMASQIQCSVLENEKIECSVDGYDFVTRQDATLFSDSKEILEALKKSDLQVETFIEIQDLNCSSLGGPGCGTTAHLTTCEIKTYMSR